MVQRETCQKCKGELKEVLTLGVCEDSHFTLKTSNEITGELKKELIEALRKVIEENSKKGGQKNG